MNNEKGAPGLAAGDANKNHCGDSPSQRNQEAGQSVNPFGEWADADPFRPLDELEYAADAFAAGRGDEVVAELLCEIMDVLMWGAL